MAVVFLIGGTGNQLFSFAASNPNDKFSTLFLSNFVRRSMGWTIHENIMTYTKPSLPIHLFALIALCIDILLVHVLQLSLFTTFDTRKIKKNAQKKELVRIGYFQEFAPKRSVSELCREFKKKNETGRIVLHIRGGDLKKLENTGNNRYGMLTASYFNSAINYTSKRLAKPHKGPMKILILTDDIKHVMSLNITVPNEVTYEVKSCSLRETMELAVCAEWFVSSNSTLAYWIVQIRDGFNCIAPLPFQKDRDWVFPEETVRLDASY